MVDALTGLGNRRHLDAALARRLSRWQRHARPFGVMMLDVDRFKVLNDTYGHDVGDRMLRLVARSMAAAARQSDDVARYGGDEFVVLSDASDEDALCRLGERLRMVVERSRIAVEGGGEVGVTISVGAVVVAAQDDAAAVLRRADEMLLRAKRTGRDRLMVAV
jgi:diguanylate cyclase (GGDEF)-like protein